MERKLLSYDEALFQLLSEANIELNIEKKPLLMTVGKSLANECIARYNTPQFDNSAMDGYALCDSVGNRLEFIIVGKVMAGDNTDILLKEGEAVRIFTGAKTPQNTTAVIMQEEVKAVGERLLLDKACRKGINIRYQGEEIKRGDILFPRGHYLDPAAIALCASQGFYELPVHEELKIIVFSSGNELCEPSEILKEGQIYDANRYQLLAWMTQFNQVNDGGILSDNYDLLKENLLKASKQNNVIILSGGASVGEADFVGKAISELGELHAWKLAIKPGKPFGWGKINGSLVLMLPGNPVAAYVTFYMLVYPLLQKLSGHKTELITLKAIIQFSKTRAEPRREFLRGVYFQDNDGKLYVDAVRAQGSAMLSGLSYANCLVEMPENQEMLAGSEVTIYPLPCKK